MGRFRRYVPEAEAVVVEITNRTFQNRFLLRPGPELNGAVHGAIARAQRRYGVDVHGFVFLSNHYHLIATIRSARQLSAFVGYFQSKIAKEVCHLHDWRDKVWARRYRHIVVVDAAAQQERFLYLLENGCKEGLVASPLDWPGAHCAKALARGSMTVSGTWFDRTRLWAARQRRQETLMREFMEPERLRMTPMPIWSHMSDERYTAHVAGLVKEIEQRTAALHALRDTEPIGPDEVRRHDPHRQPIRAKREPAPLVHATTKAARLAFRAAYNAFVGACLTATERLRATGDTSGFPEGSFLPPIPVSAFDTS